MATTESAENVDQVQSHYRAHLDGLRAVAVYLVVAFHAGLGLLTGGFIGVDVFFVLSGYLVTGILLRDLIGSGGISFGKFYARRFRRILPASAVALIVTAIVYSIIATPAETLDVLGGFKAAFLYVANWYFIHQAVDYFATDINRSPVLHFWSLAVEEQFYLVWPLLFGAIFLATRRIGRMRWWAMRGVVGVIAIASAAGAWHIASTNVNRAYYGTDTRAYQLLAGALLALSPQIMHLGRRLGVYVRRSAPLALVGLIIIGTKLFDIGPIARGLLTVVLTTLLIVALENGRNDPVARTLSARPLAYLGRISYATYLWHWPVVIIATHGRHISPLPLFILTTVLSTELAVLSYHFLEHPIRSSRALERYKGLVIAGGLAISLVSGLVILPAILTPNSSGVSGVTGAPLDWRAARADIPPLPDCYQKPVSNCVIVAGTGPRILLVGDSNARMWIPTFSDIARSRSMTLAGAIQPDCPWQRGLQYAVLDKVVNVCRVRQADWFERVIPQFDPDIVVLVHQAYDDATRPQGMIAPDGHTVSPRNPDFEKVLDDASTATLKALSAPNRKLVVIEPTPFASLDPVSCISTGGPLAGCAYHAAQSSTPLERFYRSLSNGKTQFSINPDKLVCPRFPTCDAVVDGIIVKRDVTHLTATFAASLSTQMTALLERAGVLSVR